MVAAVAMVVLITIGVVSAEVVTGSACGAVVPEPVAADAGDRPLVDGGLETELADALPGLTVLGAADVGPGTGLTRLDGDTVATGPRLTVLRDPEGPRAAAGGPVAEVDAPTVVVGDGATLFSLALVDDATGRVDAIAPVTAGLEAGECVDTAQVGTPLAFHLDAADGQALLFRIADDGDDPQVEVRDADGAVSTEPIELGFGPPGALAQRLDGRLGEELVVTARRTRTDEQPPAVQARDRASGAERWAVAPSEIARHAPPGDEALELSLVEVTGDLVLAAVSREGRRSVVLTALDADDGSHRWTSDLGAHAPPSSVGERDGGLVVTAPHGGDGERPPTQRLVQLDAGDGGTTLLAESHGEVAHAAVVDGNVLLGAGRELMLVTPDGERRAATLPARVADLVPVDGAVAVLLRDGDGGAVVWLEP